MSNSLAAIDIHRSTLATADLSKATFGTIDLHTATLETDVSASGVWSESYVRRPEGPSTLGRFGRIAGLALAIAASPATATLDVWFWERRRRDASTSTWAFEVEIGRPISRSEALRIVRQILHRAERERMEMAGWEAKRGIQWEEGA